MADMIEVTEEEFRKSKELREQVQALLAHPKARRKVLEARRELDPKVPIPELDAPDPIDEKLNPFAKQLADFKKEVDERESKREQDARIADIVAKKDRGISQLRGEGWNDEGIKAVEKIMEDQGILDPMIAAAYHEKLHPPPVPIAQTGRGPWDFMGDIPKEGDDDLKKLVETKGEDSGLLHKMAIDALNEVRGATTRR